MATTYTLIAKSSLNSTTSSIDFTNIPSGYTDLVLYCSVRTDRPVAAYDFALWVAINGSTSNRTWRRIEGYSSSVYSDSGTGALVGLLGGTSVTSNTFSSVEIYIPNYRSITNKTFSSSYVSENNSATSNGLGAVAGAWSSTEPITNLSIYGSGYNLVANSSAYLYGITRMDDGTPGYFGPAMTGGDEVYTTGNGYKVHVFKNSGTLNVTAPGEVEYLVVGGGGGGSFGGGGAGGVLSGVKYLTSNNYSIAIGAGGAQRTNGNNSFGLGFISIGGGSGGGTTSNAGAAASGGSGGGGGHALNIGSINTQSGASGVIGQGTSGGAGTNNGTNFNGGGGGGAGSSGANALSTAEPRGGNGGDGIVWPAGSNTYYGGGGGGAYGNSSSYGKGGLGGGGNSASTFQTNDAQSATANTGGGGGGANKDGTAQANPGSGGSGIVIIRYRI